MLSYRLTNCEECTTVPVLLADIDCKLTELSKTKYNAIVFGFRNDINSNPLFWDLLHYKRILQYKSCNEEWANDFTVEEIAGKVKLLIFK